MRKCAACCRPPRYANVRTGHQHARHSAGHQRKRHARRRRGGAASRRHARDTGTARGRFMRRRQLRCPAAPLRDRGPPAGARQLLGPRRAPLHGAPGDHDAGVPSVPREYRRLPEDGGDQRLLPWRGGPRVPARPDPVAGAHARCHGADRRPVDSALGVRCLGCARRRLARDVRGSAESGQSRHDRSGRTHSPGLHAEQRSGAQRAGRSGSPGC